MKELETRGRTFIFTKKVGQGSILFDSKGVLKIKKHLLIEKAYIYALPKEKPQFDGCTFNHRWGYWVNNDNKTPYVLDRRTVGPRSKKADVETGEDQKGE